MTLRLDKIGPWSEIKHSIIKEYASAYATILSAQPHFKFFYIDAFAGAGKHIRRATGEVIPGSPRIACEIKFPFQKYWFIDLSKKKTDLLEQIKSDHVDLNIEILRGDCNSILVNDIFPQISYEQYRRALCILDPYGLHLNWSVTEASAKQRTIEIFVNFPIMDMNMNVLRRKNPEGTEQRQVERMNQFWGDESWRDVTYKLEPTLDLFGDERKIKIPDANAKLARAYRDRLKKVAGFAYVPEPIPMRNTIDRQVYFLFFATHNKTANKIMSSIFKKYRKL